jgi:hypothetical protein
MFSALHGRLPKELSLFGISAVDEANDYIRVIYLPFHNVQFAELPRIAEESAFVAVSDPANPPISYASSMSAPWRDNTGAYEGTHTPAAQQSGARSLHRSPRQGARIPGLAVFHGPRLLARYDPTGTPIKQPNLRTAA